MFMIDCLYYINLDSRPDRREHIEKNVLPHLQPYVKEIQRFPAYNHTKYSSLGQRAAGCSYSHLAIWNEAIEKEYDRILVVEDDFRLIRNSQELEIIFNLLDKIVYDVCNLGYVTNGPVIKTNLKHIYRCSDIQTTSCYTAEPKFLSYMIPAVKQSADNLMMNQEHHSNAIDIVWKQFQDNPRWYLTERLGVQLTGFSDIENKFCTYQNLER